MYLAHHELALESVLIIIITIINTIIITVAEPLLQLPS